MIYQPLSVHCRLQYVSNGCEAAGAATLTLKLSRLPQRFEQVVLEPKERRDAARERVLADADQLAREAEQASFDIDAAAAEAFIPLDLRESPIALSALDFALNRKDVRPSVLEWKSLAPGSFAVSMPGMQEAARGATRAEVFEDHPESMVLLSPGGSLFEEITAAALADAEQGDGDSGICWGTDGDDSEGRRFLLRTKHGIHQVNRLGDLLAILPQTESGLLPEEWKSKGVKLVV